MKLHLIKLLRYVRLFGTLILLLGAGLVAGILVRLFILPPALEETMAALPDRRLNTGVIDQLELWIEEVEDQRRAGLKLPAHPVFVVEEIKVKEGI